MILSGLLGVLAIMQVVAVQMVPHANRKCHGMDSNAKTSLTNPK